MSAENNNGKEFVAAVFLQESVCYASLHFTGNEGTTVHIEAFDFSKTTIIGKDLWAKQDLISEICFDVKNEATATKGIRVSASDDISVAAMTTEHKHKSESYLVLPTSQLSIEYYAVSAIGNCAYSKLMIIATATRTEITLTLRVSSGKCTDSGHEDGKTIKVTLDKMEVFGLYCNKDITGTHIKSSIPVAVVSGCHGTRTSKKGGLDPVADMLIPVQLYGYNYILYNINTVLPVVYRVVAAADNTDIVLAGQADHVLQEGGFIDIRTTGADCLTASSPVLVVAFTEQTSTFGDPLMAVVQSTDHFMSSYLVYAQANPITGRTEALIGLVSSLPNIDAIVSGAQMTEVAKHAACGFSIGTFELSSDSVVYLQSSKPFGLLYIRVGPYIGMGYSGGFKNGK
ncbi:IgGFc-binding protein-like [Haliotis cracherodii]|uniref:IgGFc-binding protein-like n=1 Tax=Haliotis cracherodii TaxID=6455 RepID=UPI0039E91861